MLTRIRCAAVLNMESIPLAAFFCCRGRSRAVKRTLGSPVVDDQSDKRCGRLKSLPRWIQRFRKVRPMLLRHLRKDHHFDVVVISLMRMQCGERVNELESGYLFPLLRGGVAAPINRCNAT